MEQKCQVSFTKFSTIQNVILVSKFFSHLLASGSVDQTVLLWDLREGKPGRTLSGHNEKIQSLQWHPMEPQVLLTGCCDKYVLSLDFMFGSLLIVLSFLGKRGYMIATKNLSRPGRPTEKWKKYSGIISIHLTSMLPPIQAMFTWLMQDKIRNSYGPFLLILKESMACHCRRNAQVCLSQAHQTRP